jgi:hypothetical protein
MYDVGRFKTPYRLHVAMCALYGDFEIQSDYSYIYSLAGHTMWATIRSPYILS